MAKIKINVEGPEKAVKKPATRHIAITSPSDKKPVVKKAAPRRKIEINKPTKKTIPVAKKSTPVKKATPVKKTVKKVAAKPAPKPVVKPIVKKAAPKPVIKKTTPKPAPKPIVQKLSPAPKPAPKPIVKKVSPVPKPAPKPAPKTSATVSSIASSVVKSIATPKLAPKPAPKPVAKKVTPTPRPVARPVQRPISSTSTHRSIQRSTTLSRRYVKRPNIKTREDSANLVNIVEVSPKDAKKQERAALRRARMAKLTSFRNRKKAAKPVTSVKPAAKSANTASLAHAAIKSSTTKPKETPKPMRQSIKRKHRGRRIALALFCALLVVGGLAAFVYFSMPDISVKVAAMQTGIEASYPSFTPRGYSLSGVTSDKEGVVIISFNNGDGASFDLTEEKSTWDSNALLNNYVKKNFPSDYATIREQGITIYYRGGDAAWVNGGMLYKIKCNGGALTKEQIRNIATSM